MPRRRTRNLTGGLLDCPPGMDKSGWAANSLLERVKPAPLPQACQCRPSRGNTDLGGCKPSLRWVGPDQLEAFCQVCQKPLQAGTNKRRDQVRMIALSSMDLAHLDIPDLIDAGWLAGDRPGDGQGQQDDPALAGAPGPEAIAAAKPAESREAWLRRFY